MKSVRDKAGNEWIIVMTFDAIERVEAKIDVDLCDTRREGPVYQLIDNYTLCGRVFYALVEPQAKEKGISREIFFASLNGDVLREAAQAMWVELEDFFPQAQRDVFKQETFSLVNRSNKAMELANKLVTSGALDKAMEADREKLESLVQDISDGKRDIGSLATLGLTQEDTP